MIWLLFYIIPCILLAWLNAYLIKKQKRVFHFWNGLLHTSIAIGGYLWLKDWKAPIAILLIAKLFFDTFLNLMRGLPIDYLSFEVTAYNNFKEAIKKGKVTDFIEYKLFGETIWPKIIYAFLIVFLISFNYIFR